MKNMCRMLMGISVFGLVAMNAFGANRTVTKTSKYRPTTHFGLGQGIAITQGHTAYARTLNAAQQISHGIPLFVGLDVGMQFYGGDIGLGLDLLPTVYYRATLPSDPKFHPYFGVSMGIGIWNDTDDQVVDFVMAFRPGIEYELNDQFGIAFEPKLGINHTSFFVSPQIYLTFNLT